MGAGDMMGSGFNSDAARYDRMNRTQPAQFAPGQDAVFQQQDAFSMSSAPNDPGAMGDIFSTGIGGPSMGGGMDAMNPFGGPGGIGMGPGGMASPNSMTMSQPQPQQDASDQFWAAVGKGFKGFTDFFKQVLEANKQLTVRWYSEWGRTIMFVGLAIAVIGLILKPFGVASGLTIAAGGILCAGSGGFIWLFLTEKARTCTSKYKDGQQQMPQQQPAPAPMQDSFSGFGFDAPATDMFSSPSGGDLFGDGDDTDFFSTGSEGEEEDPYEDDPYADLEPVEQGERGMTTEEALNSLQEVPAGMYTRTYLWDMFTRRLPTMHPSFSKMRSYDEDSDTFLSWDEKLREAAGVAGCKEDFLPDLLELQENDFVIVVTCNRPQGFKPELVASELANIYAYSDGVTKNENVFAKVDTIGARCKITIFNGAAVMVSLKDMMLQQEKWIKDTKNYMPVCLGIDQLGHVITVDCKKLESIIITGMPRSGKSWFVQAVLTQMCAFVPPSELNIYICDPKEGISDFRDFTLPHVKKFVSGDANIVKTLSNLVKIEAPRRKKIIGDAGFVNIWDYKERNPDVKLPVIYVVIDEVVTLASRMDKETNNEFRMLLRELISQLPALGIRAFLIPHVLNNDIIEKKTSDLVPCKISVCGDADHIERATGSKPKEFPYKLVNKGDMAVKLTGFNNTLYVHGPAMTDSNPENSAVFEYLRKVWAKLEPEEMASSVAKAAEVKASVEQARDEVLSGRAVQSSVPTQAASIQVGNLTGTGSDDGESGGSDGDFDLFGGGDGLDFSDVAGEDDDFELF